MMLHYLTIAQPRPTRRVVGAWLLGVAVLIIAMLAVGGLTRLTGSGLSITEWDPIVGAVPPLSDTAWQEAFSKYREIPQYKLEHQGMSLDAFKGIFWWEWAHRFLGRMIGIAFFLPFLWFAATGAIVRNDWPRMLLLFALGGLQGFVGWWMVESGLEARVSVSQYRLAIHLGVAVLLLGAILWVALEYLRPGTAPTQPKARAKWAFAFAGLVYVQMILGALVAGLHAGLIYNTWPSMDGQMGPEHPFLLTPWGINFFENPGLAQFDHRMVAYLTAVSALFLWSRHASGMVKLSGDALLAITFLQVTLGVMTLLFQVPIALAALHQVTAAVLFCTAVWHAYEMRYASA